MEVVPSRLQQSDTKKTSQHGRRTNVSPRNTDTQQYHMLIQDTKRFGDAGQRHSRIIQGDRLLARWAEIHRTKV